MNFSTIIFALVFVIPLVAFILSIAWKDKRSRAIGVAVVVALVTIAVIIAFVVNKDK